MTIQFDYKEEGMKIRHQKEYGALNVYIFASDKYARVSIVDTKSGQYLYTSIEIPITSDRFPVTILSTLADDSCSLHIELGPRYQLDEKIKFCKGYSIIIDTTTIAPNETVKSKFRVSNTCNRVIPGWVVLCDHDHQYTGIVRYGEPEHTTLELQQQCSICDHVTWVSQTVSNLETKPSS